VNSAYEHADHEMSRYGLDIYFSFCFVCAITFCTVTLCTFQAFNQTEFVLSKFTI